MCRRYTQMATWSELVEYFNLIPSTPVELTPRFNVAPTQQVAAVRVEEGERRLALLKWGFIPSWSKDGKIAPINAVSEAVAEKPMFRGAFKKRPCLVPATGFYEWRKEGKAKLPVHFHLKTGSPFAFAAIWETWHGLEEGEIVESCAILTTEPNELVKPVHNRMPVIMAPEDYDDWLDPAEQDPEGVLPLLRPYPANAMQADDANPYVNNARHEGAQCLAAPA
jgi:putative SOS response-associated peptidase YedK